MSINTIDSGADSEISSRESIPRWPKVRNNGSGGEEELIMSHTMAQQIVEAFAPRVPEISSVDDGIIASSGESGSNEESVRYELNDVVRTLFYGIPETSIDHGEQFAVGVIIANPSYDTDDSSVYRSVAVVANRSAETVTDGSSVDGNFAVVANRPAETITDGRGAHNEMVRRILYGVVESSSDEDEESACGAVTADSSSDNVIDDSSLHGNFAVVANRSAETASSNGRAGLTSSGSDTEATDYTDDTGDAVVGGSTPDATSSGMSSQRTISWVDTISANSTSSGFQGTPSGYLSLDITPPLEKSDEIADHLDAEPDAQDSDDLSSVLDSDDDDYAGSIVSVIERAPTNSFLFLGINKPKIQ